MDELREVYHRGGRPRGEESEFPRFPRLPDKSAPAEVGGQCWQEKMLKLMQGLMQEGGAEVEASCVSITIILDSIRS